MGATLDQYSDSQIISYVAEELEIEELENPDLHYSKTSTASPGSKYELKSISEDFKEIEEYLGDINLEGHPDIQSVSVDLEEEKALLETSKGNELVEFIHEEDNKNVYSADLFGWQNPIIVSARKERDYILFTDQNSFETQDEGLREKIGFFEEIRDETSRAEREKNSSASDYSYEIAQSFRDMANSRELSGLDLGKAKEKLNQTISEDMQMGKIGGRSFSTFRGLIEALNADKSKDEDAKWKKTSDNRFYQANLGRDYRIIAVDGSHPEMEALEDQKAYLIAASGKNDGRGSGLINQRNVLGRLMTKDDQDLLEMIENGGFFGSI